LASTATLRSWAPANTCSISKSQPRRPLGCASNNDPRGIAVGADTERVAAVKLDEISELFEAASDVGIQDGHGRRAFEKPVNDRATQKMAP